MRRLRLLHAAHLALLLTTPACGARSALDAGLAAADGGPPGSSGTRLILFGGWEGQTEAGDTWAFDGAAWTQLQLAEAPSARNSSAVAAVSGQIVLFSGTNDGLGDPGIQTDTWTFTGDAWSPRATAHTPPGRTMRSMRRTSTTSNASALWQRTSARPFPQTPVHAPFGLVAQGRRRGRGRRCELE